MKAVFKKSEQEAPDISSYYFEPEKPLRYIAGQFIELTLPHDKPDDRGVRRWFTLTSIESDSLLRITTKLSEESSSFKKHFQALQPGDEVDVSEPMGDFVLPRDDTTPLVFVAGGMGITPFISMLRSLSEGQRQRDVKFIYAVKTEDDIIFQEVFDEAHVHATIVVTTPSEAWGGERGHLTAEHIIKLTQPAQRALIYLAGPEPMVETLEKDFKTLGIQPSRIVTDFFHGYQPV